MPTSHASQLNEIVELIVLTCPQKLLDIGVGFGKYGFLSREYLDIAQGRLERSKWKVRIDGIEVFDKYVTPIHDYVYDTVHIGNVLDILKTLPCQYDLILLIGVLEHFDREDGFSVLRQCLKQGRNALVSVPRKNGAQGTVCSNLYETHKYQWTPRDFRAFKGKCFVANPLSIICYIGDDWHDVRRANCSRRRRQRLSSVLDSLCLKEPLKWVLRR